MKALILTATLMVSLSSVANYSKLSTCIDNAKRLYDVDKQDRLIKKCISKYHSTTTLDELITQIKRTYSVNRSDKLLIKYINMYFDEMDMEQCFKFSRKIYDIDSQDMMYEKCLTEKEPLD